MGIEDTKEDITDGEILEKAHSIVKDAYSQGKGDSIKILWFVKPNEKRVPLLDLQAKFIESFNDKTKTKTNVWDSVCIICKQPRKVREDTNGAVQAAKSVGSGNAKNIKTIGYTCLNWLDKQEATKFEIIPKDTLKSVFLYYSESDICSMVSNIINKDLQAHQIFFQNNICKKCGVKGDPRFCAAKCHTDEVSYHLKEATLFHSGKLEHKHPGKKKIIKYHPKENEPMIHGVEHELKHDLTRGFNYQHGNSTHTGPIITVKVRSGTRTVRVCKECDSDDIDSRECTTGHFMGMGKPTCGTCWKVIRKGSYYHCNDCCEKDSLYHTLMRNACSRHTGCVKTKTEDVFEPRRRYDCCNGKMNAPGCRCSQCHKVIDALGCKVTHKCCGKLKMEDNDASNGCRYYYKCCDKLLEKQNVSGCRYKCCPEKEIGSSGLVGCEEKEDENYSCCDKSDAGCIQQWSCCSAEKNNGGCQFRFACCDTTCAVKDIANEKKKPSKECGKKCRKCDQAWGEKGNGNGCEHVKKGEIEHEWKPCGDQA